MKANKGLVQVRMEPTTAALFLGDVVCAADSDRDALGFFSRRVYSDYCRKGQLFVATVQTGAEEGYAGHLLFDLRFPKAHIRQIYISKGHRGKQIGKTLLDTLKSQLTEWQFISIHARVAEDLQGANAFWETQRFYAQRVERGGASRNRTIVVRAHELDTPQLFASSGISAADPLGLDIAKGTTRPLYLLDLNVLFDLGPRRPRHELAMNVFRAQRMQACSVAISTEIDVELNRTASDAKTDPMLSLAATLAKFPTPPDDEWNRLLPVLAKLVFPERYASGCLTKNDKSDLKHLATAIHHGLPGFVTSDELILDQAPELRRLFGVDVVSPEFFQVEPDHLSSTGSHEAPTDYTIEVGIAAPGDTTAIQDLLRNLGVDAATQVNEWAATDVNSSVCLRQVARCRGLVVGYLVCPASVRSNEIRAHIAVTEDQQCAHTAAQSLLVHLSGQVRTGNIGHIHLNCPPRQATLREVAGSFGYMALPSMPNDLQKIVVKQRLTDKGWAIGRDSLAAANRIGLPHTAPEFRHVDQQVPITRSDGQRTLVPLFRLETLLAPMLLCLAGRKGVMVPIRKQFEEHLLDESPQSSFLPKNKAQLTSQRHYLSDKKTLKNFTRGDLMFFYESGKNKGAGAVVAVGRVLRAYLRDESTMESDDLAPSVLGSNQLSSIGTSKTKTITVFDNVMRLPRPVPLRELQAIHCGNPHQLITSQILSAEQVQVILEKGL